jgi:alpha-ribazole phosphatase/probable phosphoglycerate mutase
MCRVVLVRHAAVAEAGSFLGQRDVALSPVGRRQLRCLGPKLSKYEIQAIYSSDLERARSTAVAAAQKLGLDVEIRKGLREMDFGSWEGLSWRQIVRRFPGLAKRWQQRFPYQVVAGAERFEQFSRRVRRVLRDIVVRNLGRCVLVVTHAGVIRTALASALGIPGRNAFRLVQDSCAINVVEYFDKGAMVRCING